MSEFIKKDKWQRDVRNRILKPNYECTSHESRFVFCDKGNLATLLLREMAIETIIQLRDDGVFSTEENKSSYPVTIMRVMRMKIGLEQPRGLREGWEV